MSNKKGQLDKKKWANKIVIATCNECDWTGSQEDMEYDSEEECYLRCPRCQSEDVFKEYKQVKKEYKKNKMIIVNNEYTDSGFSKALLKARLNAGLSRIEIAQILDKDQQQIRRYEDGEQMPPINILAKLCYVLNISPNQLMNIQEKEYRVGDTVDRIYIWKIRNAVDNRLKGTTRKDFVWECPYCSSTNIFYSCKNIFKYNPNRPLVVDLIHSLKCTKCDYSYGNINIVNTNFGLYKKIKSMHFKKLKKGNK